MDDIVRRNFKAIWKIERRGDYVAIYYTTKQSSTRPMVEDGFLSYPHERLTFLIEKAREAGKL